MIIQVLAVFAINIANCVQEVQIIVLLALMSLTVKQFTLILSLISAPQAVKEMDII